MLLVGATESSCCTATGTVVSVRGRRDRLAVWQRPPCSPHLGKTLHTLINKKFIFKPHLSVS